MNINVSVIEGGKSMPNFTVKTLEDLDSILASLGFSRNSEWLLDEDFGFDKSSTFTHANGESRIICIESIG